MQHEMFAVFAHTEFIGDADARIDVLRSVLFGGCEQFIGATVRQRSRGAGAKRFVGASSAHAHFGQSRHREGLFAAVDTLRRGFVAREQSVMVGETRLQCEKVATGAGIGKTGARVRFGGRGSAANPCSSKCCWDTYSKR